jgi:hypothetical protein
MEPKLNLGNLAGSLGTVVSLVNALSNPATLAELEADGKLAADDVQKLLADAQVAATDLAKIVADVRTALGV